jgi:hypothetical protein
MTFTYAGTLATDLDQIRFYVSDVTSGSGPKPDGTNFTDEELNGLLTAEGTVGRSVAAAFESLSAIWRTRYNFSTEGQRFDRASVADGYAKLAAEWRDKYGSPGSRVGAGPVTRIDGYSDDIDSDEDSS